MVNKRNSDKSQTPPRRIRTQVREQELKNAPTGQRVATRQLVPPDVSFAENIYITEALFFCLTYYVTPAVPSFLCRKRLVSRTATDYDYADMIQTLRYYKNIDRNLLHAPICNVEIGKAIRARNEICHLNLEAIKQNWASNLSTWTILCRSVGDAHGASNVQTVYNRLRRGQYQQAIDEKPFRFTVGAYNENTAFGLSLILYSCLARYVGPSLRKFLIRDKQQTTSTSFDVYKNLKDTIEQQKIDQNYLAKGASKRIDMELLRVAMEGRNTICHGKYSLVFSQWKTYLQSWVRLLKIINMKAAAEEMQEVLDFLAVSRSHFRQIRPSRIFCPMQSSCSA
ncbi:uncharacterized protein LOC116936537 [Daphnia magna]|uniref:uncharacterized protein LOC116936537 n=1 Tax=Daphnia magna TaxID=35525 RepID=UPI001E1BB9E6|nr:uncharacterized protein LOC116936537 [Daphnia magna]